MTDLINNGQPFLNTECRDAGLSRKQLRQAHAERRLRTMFRGVSVDAAIPETRELRIAAIRLVAPPYAVVCDCSASWIHGVDTFRPSERFDLVPSLVVPHSRTRVVRSNARCRQALIPTADVMEIDGVLVTVPVRTASDLLRKLWPPYALAAADGLAHAGLIDPLELWHYVARLKGYRGIVQARRLADLVEPDTESPGESWTRLRLVDAGFPRPEPQFVVTDRHGREIYRLDLAYPEQQVAVEYDGMEFHTDDPDSEHDDGRRQELRDRWGWRFVVADRKSIFGDDVAFEREVGDLLGRTPLLPRQW
ncbi:hypothetical protein [Solicola gregarius]|uniref:DUF559 domain-containing protein n=1 Tax=Solicola gregarius TaxID=2908642 RepID=A0AA46TID0_9ACTN|nr:hypothetical protein [Solicola gregarius]UYM05063.1 hypothetical protein L0C25_21490 [Solicola gregarius]